MAYASPKSSKPVAPAPPRFAKEKLLGASCRLGSPSFIGSAPRLGAASSPPTPVVQTKLEVGPPNDRFEQEADRVADQVLRGAAVGPLSPIAMHPQRKCTACEAEDKETLRRQADEDEEELRLKAEAGRPQAVAGAEAAAAMAQGGRSLSPAERAFFEPRFGRDFTTVRIHDDPCAHSAAEAVNARAFTVGHAIAFARGEYAPGTLRGDWLMAHELAHTLQQSQSALEIRRFVPCTRARLSLEECPGRESGEVTMSRRTPMIVEYVESPVQGYVVADFGVGQSPLKSDVKRHPNWMQLIQAMTIPDGKWNLVGLSDCHGDDRLNASLRQERADAVRAALPATVAAQVVSAAGAPLYDCITDNTTRVSRAWNRSVLISLESRTVTFSPAEIEGTRPVPKPQAQPTVDCSRAQQDEIAQAHPIAVAMVRKALHVLGRSQTPEMGSVEKIF